MNNQFIIILQVTDLNHGSLVSQFNFVCCTVFAKTAGLSDKTARFPKCPANFVSLPDSMSDEKFNPDKYPDSVFG